MRSLSNLSADLTRTFFPRRWYPVKDKVWRQRLQHHQSEHNGGERVQPIHRTQVEVDRSELTLEHPAKI